jgi:DNA-binding NarL/FixJ family response regulator
LVALANPDPEAVVAVLSARDRRVIVYGGDEGEPFFEAVAAGAVGFVSDRANASDFVRAAEALREGAVSVFPEHTGRRLAQRGWFAAEDSDAGWERLTRREREVLGGLTLGLRPAEIAQRDFVSVTTVRNQVQAILTKLNVHSQLEAVAMAHRFGWLVASERTPPRGRNHTLMHLDHDTTTQSGHVDPRYYVAGHEMTSA